MGQPLFKLLLRILGALAGIIGGLWIYSEYFQAAEWALWTFPIVLGLVGLLVVWFAFLVGVFLAGAGFGAVAAYSSLGLEAGAVTPTEGWVIAAAAALCGVITLLLKRFFLTLATAFLGAWTLLAGVVYFATGRYGAPVEEGEILRLLEPPPEIWFRVALIILGGAGLITQFQQSRKRDAGAKNKEHAEA
jgi:hypothetical protein